MAVRIVFADRLRLRNYYCMIWTGVLQRTKEPTLSAGRHDPIALLVHRGAASRTGGVAAGGISSGAIDVHVQVEGQAVGQGLFKKRRGYLTTLFLLQKSFQTVD